MRTKSSFKVELCIFHIYILQALQIHVKYRLSKVLNILEPLYDFVWLQLHFL